MSKVLLIVDMQNGFITKKAYSNLVIKINSLIKKIVMTIIFLLNLLTKKIAFMSKN